MKKLSGEKRMASGKTVENEEEERKSEEEEDRGATTTAN